MCVGRDSSCYSRDGRYFGQGTRNYDVECDKCGNLRTIGAPDRKTALARYRAAMGSYGQPCTTCGRT